MKGLNHVIEVKNDGRENKVDVGKNLTYLWS